MFDGVADQFHHLIASRPATSSSSLPSSASLPLHHLPLTFTHLTSTPPTSVTNAIATTIFPGFDLSHHLEIQQPISQFLHHQLNHLHHPTTSQTLQKEEEKSDEVEDEDELACMKLLPPPGSGEDCPWTDEEVLALVRIRSSIENWFPEVTWEHVSRKLEELGFKRSADKCKEKFEEGSRFFDSNNNNDDNSYGKSNFRILSELQEICNGDHGRNSRDPNVESNENEMEEGPEVKEGETSGVRDSEKNRVCVDEEVLWLKGRMKRKRQRKKFEMFKTFCEEVVEKLMVQQEEMHSKLLEDLVKRDEEMVAREEEWKKREMDRIDKELDTRANEQALTGDRKAIVIELLKKFTSYMPHDKILRPVSESGEAGDDDHSFSSSPLNNCSEPTSARPPPTDIGDLHCKSKYTKSVAVSDTQTYQTTDEDSPSGQKDQNPKLPGTHVKNPKPLSVTKVNDLDVGSKRWPRDEVQALINLRSGIDNREKADHSWNKGSQGEAPLWERISRGMTELGYRRSAKRCKEKWENINKYFRKTKDLRKKRSADSRTCPYFQQLSNLYGHGMVVTPSPSPAVGAANDGAV